MNADNKDDAMDDPSASSRPAPAEPDAGHDDQREVIKFKVAKKGPRPWNFDLDNLPQEFTAEILGGLTLDEVQQLEKADLDERQRESLRAAEVELFAPVAKAASSIFKGTEINRRLAETVGRAFKPMNDRLAAIRVSALPEYDFKGLGLSDVGIDLPALSRSPEARLLGELVDHHEAELAERQDQIDRERQMLELLAKSVASQEQIAEHQAALVAEQKAQAVEARKTRRISIAVLFVTTLTFVVGVIAALRM